MRILVAEDHPSLANGLRLPGIAVREAPAPSVEGRAVKV
jgi:hypothetical protein